MLGLGGVRRTKGSPMRSSLSRSLLLLLATALTVLGHSAGTAYAATTWPGGDRVTIATGLSRPWGVAQLRDGTFLVSERDTGVVWRLTPQGRTQVGRIEPSGPLAEGGLLGLVLDPSDRNRGYAYLSTAEDNRVVPFTWDGRSVTAGRPILTGIPRGRMHNGGRLRFGPDGYLYVSTGDTGVGDLAQDKNSLAGKILRITRTGAPAPGNPFGTPVYSMGHRHIQGLDFDADGRLWASELGAEAFDELNLIRAGGNYGWPVVEGPADDARFMNPVHWWRPVDMSPSGVTVLGDRIYLAALRGTSLWEVSTLGGTPRRLLQNVRSGTRQGVRRARSARPSPVSSAV